MRVSCLLLGLLLVLAGPAAAQRRTQPPPIHLPPAENAEISAILAQHRAARPPAGPHDPRLYYGEPLAQAVARQRLGTMRRLLRQHPDWLAYHDPNNNGSLLTLAVLNGRRRATAELLRQGADPNERSRYDGHTALIDALFELPHPGPMVRLLLAHGADPNRLADSTLHTAFYSPLEAAASMQSPATVRELVRAGANPQMPLPMGHSLLLQGAVSRDPDFVYYLVTELHQDITQPLSTTLGGTPHYLVDWMREWYFDLGSKRHAQKMKLAAYLKEHGQDYWKAPIPNHPGVALPPQDYLDKY